MRSPVSTVPAFVLGNDCVAGSTSARVMIWAGF
jgi:hypothetical protein